MGLDIFYCSLRPELHDERREKLLTLLHTDAVVTADGVVLTFPDGSSGEVWGATKAVLSSLMFSHCRGRMFLSRILQIADQFDGCLAVDVDVCVPREDLLVLLPKGLEDNNPVVVGTVEDFDAWLGGNRL